MLFGFNFHSLLFVHAKHAISQTIYLVETISDAENV